VDDPRERMKMRKEHRVPLSDQALALLRALPRVKVPSWCSPRLAVVSYQT